MKVNKLLEEIRKNQKTEYEKLKRQMQKDVLIINLNIKVF